MDAPMAGDYRYDTLPTEELGAAPDAAFGRQESEESIKEAREEKERHDADVQKLQVEASRIQGLQEQAQKQVDNLNAFWGNKAKDLESGLEDLARKRRQVEEELQHLEHQGHDDMVNKPSGPKCLYWVRGSKFTALCSLVVVTNLVTMFMEMLHPHYKKEFFLLDQVVLVFYITEIVLKSLLFRGELLHGPCSIVWWNWLDLVIVIVGILDQWGKPLLSLSGILTKSKSLDHHHGRHHQSQMVQIVKMLRIARLARILKTIRAFMESDLSWAEGKNFQLFIMGTIGANSIIMSFESDYPDFPGWFYVEQALLMIFSFELLVRLRHWGCRFFIHETDLIWNWLDFIIVFGGIIDQWLMPAFSLVEQLMGMKSHHGGQMGEIMTTLRMARLLRILRLVRLVKNIPPLFTLIVGILQAMQGMAWVLVLTAVFLYAFAILSVRLVGHGLLFGGNAPPEVAQIFPTVPQSMFVLFKVMNGDTEPVEPLFQALPISKLGFVLYMVVSSWAILSILTAVVSENMINATEAHREELEEELSATRADNSREYLSELFSKADKDGSGELGEDEFEGLLSDEATCKMITDQTRLQKQDLEQVFSLLMTTDKVSRDVFIEALQTESRTVTERSVFRLEKRLIDLQTSFVKHLNHVAEKEQAAEEEEITESHKVEKLMESLFLRVNQNDVRIESTLARIADQMGLRDTACHGRVASEAVPMPITVENHILDTSAGGLPKRSHVSLVENHILDTSAGGLPQRSDALPGYEKQAPSAIATRAAEDINKRLLPFESALKRIEHRLDTLALEANLQRLEKSSNSPKELQESPESLLAKLEEHLGMSKHRLSLQSILRKVEVHLDTMQGIAISGASIQVEPLIQKLDIQLQTHQQSATEQLMAKIERKMDMSHSLRQVQSEFACLIGKYEQRLNAEMNRGVSAIQALSAILRPGIVGKGTDARTIPSWNQAQFANNALSSIATATDGIPSVTEESDQVAGLATSARGATGGTLE